MRVLNYNAFNLECNCWSTIFALATFWLWVGFAQFYLSSSLPPTGLILLGVLCFSSLFITKTPSRLSAERF